MAVPRGRQPPFVIGPLQWSYIETINHHIAMRLFLLLTIVSLLGSCTNNSSCPTASTQQFDKQADETALRQLKEKDWPRSYREQDTALLNKILADEFQMIDDEGNISTKARELDYISKNKPSYDSFHFDITRLEVFENGTAVVSGTGHIKGQNEKGSYNTIYQSSNILIKRNGQWKAIASHVSGVKENNK
jgi:hypothetical protein